MSKAYLKVDSTYMRSMSTRQEFDFIESLSTTQRADWLLIAARLQLLCDGELLNSSDLKYLLSTPLSLNEDLTSKLSDVIQECIRYKLGVPHEKPLIESEKRSSVSDPKESRKEASESVKATDKAPSSPKFNI